MNINLYFQSVFWLTKRDDRLVPSKATTVSSHDSHFEFLQVNVCKLSKIPVFSYDPFWQQQTSTDSSYHSRYQLKLNWWTFKVTECPDYFFLTRQSYRRAGVFFPGHSSAKYYQQWYATFERKWVITEWPKRHQVSGPSWNIHQGQCRRQIPQLSLGWIDFDLTNIS